MQQPLSLLANSSTLGRGTDSLSSRVGSGLLLVPTIALLTVFFGCTRSQNLAKEPESVGQAQPASSERLAEEPKREQKQWALAIHGGAGAISPGDGNRERYFNALEGALRMGRQRLADGEAALDVVETVVAQLEDDPLFNAGRGAVFTSRRTHELDAAIMDGRSLACGTVAGVRNVRNPIHLARQVLEKSPHVFLSGSGADEFSREVGVGRVQQKYFSTPHRLDQLLKARQRERKLRTEPASATGFGTVGAVALDRYGNLAAATSTGGLTNKRFGRVGDVPVIGAGTYADNRTAAISCTGKGEEFIRHTVAFDVTARMKYKGESLSEATNALIHDTLDEGLGGLIAVDSKGNIAMPFSTEGMYRGAADSDGLMSVAIWEETRSLAVPAPAARGETPVG